MGSFGIDFSNRDALENTVSDNGVVTLQWDAVAGEGVEVEQVRPGADGSKILYSGKDASTVITGLREGHYSFRIRESDAGAWSEPVQIEVKFVSPQQLYSLLILGGIVVIATIGTIARGALSLSEKEGEA